jgi:hypothetical protein
MAFLIHAIDGRPDAAIEYHPAGTITPQIGMMLTMNSSGQLTAATGSTKPTYMSMCERKTACTAGELIPVVRVLPDTRFATTFSVAASSVKPGQKVTISSDGMQVTATTSDGVAEIVDMDDTAAGSACRVRFA